MIEDLHILKDEQALLFWSTIYTASLLLPSLALMAFDSRLVTSANPWLKPVKFELSIVIFNLTVGWMLLRLASPGMSAKVIGWVVALAMCIEITAIFFQAARGVPSHYNVSTPLNQAIFASMGIAIALTSLAVLWLNILYFLPQPGLPPAVAWGIRLGLILFLMSCYSGFQMVGNQGHTVGASDGGPGLPVLRWSTIAGDLRVAHFAGMHAIQILPFIGYALSRSNRQTGTWVVTSAFVAMLGLFVWTLSQAWARRPLVR